MALTKIDDRGLKTPIDLIDNEKIRFGTGNDLQIYHSGSHSFISNTTGTLQLENTGNVTITKGGSENMARFVPDGAVELYYDNVKKLETTSTGITITGGFIATNDADCFFTGATSGRDMLWDVSRDSLVFKDNAVIELGTGTDLQIYHNGSHSYIINGASSGTLNIRSDSHVYIQDFDGNTMADFNDGGAVELSYDGTKKFETASYGAGVTGYLQVGLGGGTNGLLANDNVKLRLGTDQDLEIYHDGTNSTINNATGYLAINSDNIVIRSVAQETGIQYQANAAVDLYYDGVKRFETKAGGIKVYGGSIEVSANEGGDANFYMYADEGDDNADNWLVQAHSNGFWALKNYADAAWETSIEANGSGNVELYYDNSKKFETTSNGISVTGSVIPTGNVNLGDSTNSNNNRFIAGASDDLQIYHDGSHSYISDTGTGSLKILSNSLRVVNAANTENIIAADEDGSVELYHDGSKKFSTESTGPHLHGLSAGSGYSDVRYQTDNGRLYYDSSTRLVKTDISDSHYGIDALKQLKPRKYKRIDIEGTPNEIGFIADEVVSVIPEIVPFGPKSFYTKNDSDTEEIPINVDYRRMTVVLTKALQEAITKIETLETKVAALEAA